MRGIVLLLALAACSEPGLMPRAATAEAEEYAVYRAALHHVYRERPVVLAERTRPHRYGPRHAEIFAGVEPELVEDLTARSAEPLMLRAEGFAPRAGVRVAPQSLLDPLEDLRRRDAHAWALAMHERLRLVFPEAWLVSLSRAGFNRGRTRALVHVSEFCGLLCAERDLMLLEKRGGEWVVVRSLDYLAS